MEITRISKGFHETMPNERIFVKRRPNNIPERFYLVRFKVVDYVGKCLVFIMFRPTFGYEFRKESYRFLL
jgi:hypothetical protein